MKLNDVAIVVTTFMRENDCQKCISSIRELYPEIKVLVADNGRHEDDRFINFLDGMKVDYIILPFDTGVSKTRNVAFDNLMDYPYILLLEDDMELTEDSRIEKFKAVLESEPGLGMIAGALDLDNGSRTLWAQNLVIDKKEKMLFSYPIEDPIWYKSKGVRWHYADQASNFVLMRNNEDIRWDSNLKSGGEHIDFAIHIKLETEWKCAVTDEVVCKHHAGENTPGYLRRRRRGDTWPKIRKKRGLLFWVENSRKAIWDYKNARAVFYPEYIYGLMKSINESTGKKLERNKDFLIKINRGETLEVNLKRPNFKEVQNG